MGTRSSPCKPGVAQRLGPGGRRKLRLQYRQALQPHGDLDAQRPRDNCSCHAVQTPSTDRVAGEPEDLADTRFVTRTVGMVFPEAPSQIGPSAYGTSGHLPALS
eukprot:5796253-Amphidinium_carterae.1